MLTHDGREWVIFTWRGLHGVEGVASLLPIRRGGRKASGERDAGGEGNRACLVNMPGPIDPFHLQSTGECCADAGGKLWKG